MVFEISTSTFIFSREDISWIVMCESKKSPESRQCRASKTYVQDIPVNQAPKLQDLRDFMESAESDAIVYVYILSTLSYRDGRILQRGSGPNFAGGVTSLCTCKHWMRTFTDVRETPRLWIGGLTSRNLVPDHPGNYVCYLMRVPIENRYSSHFEAWNSLPDHVRQAKNARVHHLGDVYEPLPTATRETQFDPSSYYPPVESHPHFTEDEDGIPYWHHDINPRYQHADGTRKACVLLFGDPRASFVWENPSIAWEKDKGFTQGQRKMAVRSFLAKLHSE